MEPTRATFELFKNKMRESAELRKVANGFIVTHYPAKGPMKEYVAKTRDEAKTLIAKCLDKEVELSGDYDDEDEDEKSPSPAKYPNAF